MDPVGIIAWAKYCLTLSITYQKWTNNQTPIDQRISGIIPDAIRQCEILLLRTQNEIQQIEIRKLLGKLCSRRAKAPSDKGGDYGKSANASAFYLEAHEYDTTRVQRHISPPQPHKISVSSGRLTYDQTRCQPVDPSHGGNWYAVLADNSDSEPEASKSDHALEEEALRPSKSATRRGGKRKNKKLNNHPLLSAFIDNPPLRKPPPNKNCLVS